MCLSCLLACEERQERAGAAGSKEDLLVIYALITRKWLFCRYLLAPPGDMRIFWLG